MKLKILLTIPFFYPHKGGAQKYAEEIYANMIGIYPDTIVDVLCYNTDKALPLEKYRNLNIHRLPCFTLISGKFVLPKIFPLVKKLIELSSNNYDYVNSHAAFFDTTWWAWMYAKKIGAKSIFTAHAPGNPVHHIKSVGLIGRFIQQTIGKWSINHYDFVTYANNQTKNYFENRMRITKSGPVFHVSVDPLLFNQEKINISAKIPHAEYLKSNNDVLISYVGRMIETKGIYVLFTAIKMLKERLDPALWDRLKFVFAGSGDAEIPLRSQAESSGLKDKIFILGNLEYKEVSALLKNTDIFVSPSSHPEGLPTTIIEAGACGCFVIATNSGSIADVIIDKSTGLLIPTKNVEAIADAIIWALNNNDQRIECQQNLSKMILDNFIWKSTSRSYYSFLEKNKNRD